MNILNALYSLFNIQPRHYKIDKITKQKFQHKRVKIKSKRGQSKKTYLEKNYFGNFSKLKKPIGF